jgi:hypothetical protein
MRILPLYMNLSLSLLLSLMSTDQRVKLRGARPYSIRFGSWVSLCRRPGFFPSYPQFSCEVSFFEAIQNRICSSKHPSPI